VIEIIANDEKPTLVVNMISHNIEIVICI